MNKLIAFWNLLDGYKTVIGAVIMIIAPAITSFSNDFLIAIWNVNPVYLVFIPKLVASLLYIGRGLAIIGLLHKAVKGADNTPAEDKPAITQTAPVVEAPKSATN